MTAPVDPFDDGLYDPATLAAIEGWERHDPAPPPRTPAWRRAAGAVLGAALLGLGEALEGRRRREQPPLVAEDPGQPHDPEALVDLDFDPSSPARTTARLRRRRPEG